MISVPVIIISLVSLVMQLIGCAQLLMTGNLTQFIFGVASAFMYAALSTGLSLFFLIVADNIAPIWKDG